MLLVLLTEIRPFTNYWLKPLSESESWCLYFHMKMRFQSHVNSFSYNWFSTKPRFDREASGNWKMNYCTLLKLALTMSLEMIMKPVNFKQVNKEG